MRRFLEMLVAFVAASIMALVGAPPAQAGDIVWTQKKVITCPSNHFCLYPDGAYGQPSYHWEPADFPVGWCMQGLPQNTSYIDNNMGRRFYVYQTTNCSGYPGTIYPRSEGPMTGVWNNSIRSVFASSLTY